MSLTKNREVDRYVDQDIREYGLRAGVHIHKGALLEFDDQGYVRPVVGQGIFAGIAYEEKDNVDGASGDATVRVITQGDFSLPLVGAAPADVGHPVYAIDDDQLGFDSLAGTLCGSIRAVPTPGVVVLRIGFDIPGQALPLRNRTVSGAAAENASGCVFSNRGAVAPVEIVLPASVPAGVHFRFVNASGAALRVRPAAGGSHYVKGARQAAGKYLGLNDIGTFVHFVADGAGDWVAVAASADDALEIEA